MVHVDAYRLSTLAEISQLDLVSDLQDSVLVVEWGKGLINDLVENPVEIKINLDESNLNKRIFTITAKEELLRGLR